MALDESLAIAIRKGLSPPTLRFYGWQQPSVTIGAFQKISDINTLYCSQHNVQVVRRPTGGRGILHGDELTYSFCSNNEGLFSNGLLDAYRNISGAFSLALKRLGLPVVMQDRRLKGRDTLRSPLCFQATSYGELTINGRKLIGSAQKRWCDGFLQQGSIPYRTDCIALAAVFNDKGQSATSNGREIIGLKDLVPDFDADELKKYLRDSFEVLFGISLVASLPSDQEAEEAQLLCSEKYRQPLWTRGELRGQYLCNNEI
ncbi:MAG: lipoate--protein ligase family protein [Nitrospirae bacterium]|nr:lipoate--protein ligase family protein [Nitrospirota bacterium]